MSNAKREPVAIDLALQGGGSHGALTWGVLDRLLEEDWLVIKALSGTSAGAMNAAVLSDGFALDGAPGARAALEDFWRQVAEAALWSPLQRTPLDRLLGRWTLDQSPFFIGFELAARMISPYEMNPAAYHPLRDILARTMDPVRLAASPIKVFVTATQVRTGRGKVFRNAEGEVLGSVPFREDFAHSCNTAFVGQADALPAQQLTDVATSLGYRELQLGTPVFGGSVPLTDDRTERPPARQQAYAERRAQHLNPPLARGVPIDQPRLARKYEPTAGLHSERVTLRQGIDGEIVIRNVNEGRAEITNMWGRPESARREFRERRSF